ncbi:MAG: hypothetical protein IJP43_01955 [Oscillospiraceae bacterium]|nr:hypothetical protein [Oscillospiraceae bacterium]
MPLCDVKVTQGLFYFKNTVTSHKNWEVKIVQSYKNKKVLKKCPFLALLVASKVEGFKRDSWSNLEKPISLIWEKPASRETSSC